MSEHPETASESTSTSRILKPKRKRARKAIIASVAAVAVIAGGVAALTLPPVKEAIAAAFVSATGIENAPKAENTAAPKAVAEDAASSYPEGVENGGAITAEEAAIVQEAYRNGDKSHKGYRMADGTWVLLATDEKLPQAVKDDFVVQTPDYTAEGATDFSDQIASAARVRDTGGTAKYVTGRLVIVIGQMYGSIDEWVNNPKTYWGASGYGKLIDERPADTAEQAIANATAYLHDAGVTEFEVIVID